jgi:hypothetical protein
MVGAIEWIVGDELMCPAAVFVRDTVSVHCVESDMLGRHGDTLVAKLDVLFLSGNDVDNLVEWDQDV